MDRAICRPGADAPGYLLPPLRGFILSLVHLGRGRDPLWAGHADAAWEQELTNAAFVLVHFSAEARLGAQPHEFVKHAL